MKGGVPVLAVLLLALAVTSAVAPAWVVDDYDYGRDEGAGGGAEAYVHGWSNTYDYYQRPSFGGRCWYNFGARLLDSGRSHRYGPSGQPAWARSHRWVKAQLLWLPPWFPVVTYDAYARISLPQATEVTFVRWGTRS